MSQTRKAAVTMLLVGTGLAAALPLSAQTTQAPSDTPTRHHMMSGDMGAMMRMMGEMRTMADACQRMMQGTANQPGKDTDHPHHSPPPESGGTG